MGIENGKTKEWEDSRGMDGAKGVKGDGGG